MAQPGFYQQYMPTARRPNRQQYPPAALPTGEHGDALAPIPNKKWPYNGVHMQTYEHAYPDPVQLWEKSIIHYCKRPGQINHVVFPIVRTEHEQVKFRLDIVPMARMQIIAPQAPLPYTTWEKHEFKATTAYYGFMAQQDDTLLQTAAGDKDTSYQETILRNALEFTTFLDGIKTIIAQPWMGQLAYNAYLYKAEPVYEKLQALSAMFMLQEKTSGMLGGRGKNRLSVAISAIQQTLSMTQENAEDATGFMIIHAGMFQLMATREEEIASIMNSPQMDYFWNHPGVDATLRDVMPPVLLPRMAGITVLKVETQNEGHHPMNPLEHNAIFGVFNVLDATRVYRAEILNYTTRQWTCVFNTEPTGAHSLVNTVAAPHIIDGNGDVRVLNAAEGLYFDGDPTLTEAKGGLPHVLIARPKIRIKCAMLIFGARSATNGIQMIGRVVEDKYREGALRRHASYITAHIGTTVFYPGNFAIVPYAAFLRPISGMTSLLYDPPPEEVGQVRSFLQIPRVPRVRPIASQATGLNAAIHDSHTMDNNGGAAVGFADQIQLSFYVTRQEDGAARNAGRPSRYYYGSGHAQARQKKDVFVYMLPGMVYAPAQGDGFTVAGFDTNAHIATSLTAMAARPPGGAAPTQLAIKRAIEASPHWRQYMDWLRELENAPMLCSGGLWTIPEFARIPEVNWIPPKMFGATTMAGYPAGPGNQLGQYSLSVPGNRERLQTMLRNEQPLQNLWDHGRESGTEVMTRGRARLYYRDRNGGVPANAVPVEIEPGNGPLGGLDVDSYDIWSGAISRHELEGKE